MMLCPICRKEMEKGGLIASGVSVMWHPQAEFAKKGLRRLVYTGGKMIGRSNALLSQTPTTARSAAKSSGYSM